MNFEKLEYARKNNIIDPIFYISYNNLPFSDIITAIDHFNNVGIYDDNIIPHKSIISSYHIVNTKFIGGTIYWARYNILFNFFSKIPLYQLIYQLLEEQYTTNEKGTIVHAMERFLCMIIYIMKYDIYAI